MINSNRVVPITRTDLLSAYGTMMKLAGTSVAKVNATTPGVFAVTGSGNIGNKLASEPVKSLDFASGVTAAVIYFVAASDFEGFSINGVAEEVQAGSAQIVAGSATLYTATLASGDITIAEIAV